MGYLKSSKVVEKRGVSSNALLNNLRRCYAEIRKEGIWCTLQYNIIYYGTIKVSNK